VTRTEVTTRDEVRAIMRADGKTDEEIESRLAKVDALMAEMSVLDIKVIVLREHDTSERSTPCARDRA